MRLSALAFCQAASAQGWLAGGSVGPTQQFAYSVGGPIATFDDSDEGFRVFGGYLFAPTQGVYDYNDSATSLSFGLGSEVNLGVGERSAWGFHFEWQLFRDVGDKNNSGHEYDRKMVSVGIDYRFGL